MHVVEVMQKGGNFIGSANVVYECSFSSHSFDQISFTQCPREANVVDHFLASQLVDTQTIVRNAEPPVFLPNALTDDA